jgi:predicted ribosomally synthesized peptide with nif11-like leader
MSVEQAEAFVARLDSDPAFADRLAEVKESPDQVFELVKAEGFDATPEEIREVFLEHFGSELNEDQLAAIAGGLSNEQIGNIATGVGVTVAVGAIAGASAAAAA